MDTVKSTSVPGVHGGVFLNPDGSDIGDALPTSGNNPSLSIAEATVGTVTTTTIQKTIGATTYEQTIEEDSSDNSVEVSNWSEI